MKVVARSRQLKRAGLWNGTFWIGLAAFGCQSAPPKVPRPSAPPTETPRLDFVRVAPQSGAQVAMPKAMEVLVEELERAKRELTELEAKRPEAERQGAPYFLSYEVFDVDNRQIGAKNGALTPERALRLRILSADVRIGSYELDSTHPLDDVPYSMFGVPPEVIASEPTDTRGLRQQVFRATNYAYRQAVERYEAVRAGGNIKVDIEDKTGDFAPQAPTQFIGTTAQIPAYDVEVWERRLRDASKVLSSDPNVLDSALTLDRIAQTRWLVNSEGTRIQTGDGYLQVVINAETKAEDGMNLTRAELFNARTLEGLPNEEQLKGVVQRVKGELSELRKAPLAEPYVGPAILRGRAAAVMFHEVFGHRIEGERQKVNDEGQTFAKKVGELITSDFVDIYDDPTLSQFAGTDLIGHYRFDDEGVPAENVSLVRAGKLMGFLQSRIPVRGVNRSNGHGRRSAGMPTIHSRQGNLVVEAKTAVSFDELRRQLLAEVKRQSKPYGLLFTEITGGFTHTSRNGTQGYKVNPVMVYRIWADGRPDQLIRGVDIVGTPLTGLTKILAAGNDYAVFNGICGAESGWVPVSAVSPSLLIGQIEVALRDKSSSKPPVLPPPAAK